MSSWGPGDATTSNVTDHIRVNIIWEQARTRFGKATNVHREPVRRTRRIQHNAWDVLGLPRGSSYDACRQRYKTLAKQLHPDLGGTGGWMKALNAVWDYIEAKHG